MVHALLALGFAALAGAGTEFLIAGGCIGTREDLQLLAERIHGAVGTQTLNVDGDVVPLRCSVGVALSTPGDDVETLISEADRALYAAKRQGRDRVCWDTGTLPHQRTASDRLSGASGAVPQPAPDRTPAGPFRRNEPI